MFNDKTKVTLPKQNHIKFVSFTSKVWHFK